MEKAAATETIILDWISDEDLAKGYSRVDQQNVLSTFCRKNNITPLKSFTLDAESGLSKILSEILDFLDTQPKEKKFRILAYKIPNWRRDSVIESRFISRTNVGTLEFASFDHPCFIEPENPHTKIWRYINLPKFLDMLQSQTLYFARADELRKADKFEGSFETQPTIIAKEMVRRGVAPVPHGMDLNQWEQLEAHMVRHNEEVGIKQNFINCWHMSDFENFAMWKIYSDSYGLCIRSTLDRLRNSITDSQRSYYGKDRRIYIGKVNYIDRQSAVIPRDNGFWPYIHKNVEYRYEQELRCIWWNTENWGPDSHPEYYKIGVDLNQLIEKIYILAPQRLRGLESPSDNYAKITRLIPK
jgi:hypothetical protein